MRMIKDIPYCGGAHFSQALDLYLPDGEDFPTFVYFHGGGLTKGDKAKAAQVGAFLAERGIAYATANYRMYPDAHYPDFILDAASAVAWVKEAEGDCPFGTMICDFVGKVENAPSNG